MNVFSDNRLHTVTCANVNYYTAPFVHPRRRMREHDFIYLLQGEWVLGQNEEVYRLEEDTLLILFAENTHYGVTPCKAGTKTMYFHASLEEGDRFGNEETLHSIPTYMRVADRPNVKSLFASVVNAKLSDEQRKANLYLELLLCELANPGKDCKEVDFAQSIKNIIHTHPERFFNNEELARMCGVCVKTAETKFKAAFGETIHQYILEFKIREAKSYFERFEGISIKEVAYNLGFCDEYHFSKQFSKHVGISPREYKKGKIDPHRKK